MRIVIAIDSFKGSLTTFMSASAITEGIKRVYQDVEISSLPLADGGEGTVEAVITAVRGEYVTATVKNPLGKPVKATYGIIPESKTAVVEMSAAAGITLIGEEERNPLNTTTYGVGELILDAIMRGCRSFVIGIGGSATNDGGIGMLQALGFEFLDKDSKQVSFGARGLEDIVSINTQNVNPLLKECTFKIACDVKNPLCGEDGCSAVYGPQKGATPQMVKDMDAWLKDYAKLTKEVLPNADENFPGAGAAGGLGYAFMSYLGGKLTSGVELVIKETGLESYIKESDIVITGEGRLDAQTSMGKAPIGVAKLAKKYKKKVIAFSGAVTDGAELCNEHGIDAFFPILRKVCTLDEAMDVQTAYKNMADTAEQVFRLIKSVKDAVL